VTRVHDVAELVRLPAALTVPGDVLAGASAARWPAGRRTLALPAASVCLYWAGMALNDYADRHVDATERPERPIPSGRVRPGTALGIAGGLTAAGLGLAATAGAPALAVALPLAGAVWTYDLAAKSTPLGPVIMGAARGLDVLLGAAGNLRPAMLPALLVTGHTVAVTALSRGEVHGTRPSVAVGAAAGTAAVAALTATRTAVRHPVHRGAAVALSVLYAATVGRSQARAAASPDAGTVRRATGAGIRGLIPLQAALTAGGGSLLGAAALVAAGPVARAAARKISPT
jgi:hypothetical protein